ncbi:MAG: GNAT family N-acetyltransferase [Clostridiales bacterium]|nr:GNAT family N-acetyltransferase [Clostridiales bacterium]
MKLRKITPDEFITMQNNMNIAFRFERTETPVDSNNESDFCYGAYTDDGIMTSSVIANPYKCCYWGQDVGMCGVGGVATFPEYRREGHMRHLLPFVLKAAYDRGDVLSSLFPFSHPFYRKFGFECGHPVQYMDFGMEAFKDIPYVGSVKQFLPGGDFSEIKAIYARFQKKHNFLCQRSDAYWQHRFGKDPYVTHHHTYIWYDENAQARAYCLLDHLQSDDSKSYSVLDWAFDDVSALRGLFGFFRLLTPSAERMSFKLPADVNPFSLFPEPYDISVSTKNCGMVRIINAAEALRLHPWPAALGGFSVRVHDSNLADNDHTYRVSCSSEAHVTLDDDSQPDLEVSIQALSVLLTGVMDLPAAIANRADVQLHRPSDALLAAFPANAGFLVENF